MRNEIFPPKKLEGVGQLFKKSWAFYRAKIKTILGILIIPVGFSVLSGLLINFLSLSDIVYSFWFSVILAFTFLVSIFLWFWAIPSLLYCFKENAALRQSYERGLKILVSYIWVYFLSTVIITGGFLLFIIPGILFSICFSLAIFVLIFEEKKGLNALFGSKHLVKGKFWGVLVRFLALGLIIGIGLFLAFALVGFGIKNEQLASQLGEVIGYFLQLFVLPFFLIYGFSIYNNLSEIKSGTIYQEPKKLTKIKYVIPGILGTLIAGFLFSISFFNIFWGRDIPPINDSDLWLSKVEIPEDKNAFSPLSQASEKLYIPQEGRDLFNEMGIGESWDDELAEELIENNEEVFELFEKAVELPYLQFPELQDPEIIGIYTVFSDSTGFLDIARLNSIKANYLFRQGNEEEALDLVVGTIEMGQMIEDSPRSKFINYLVGLAVKGIGLQGLKMMIPNLTLSSEALKNYIVELEQFKENEQGLTRTVKIEYIFLSNSKAIVDMAFVGESREEGLEMLEMEERSFEMRAINRLNYLYKPNQTQEIFAEYFRNYTNNADKECYQMELIGIERKTILQRHSLKILFTENAIGKMMYEMMTGYLDSAFNRKCLEDFSVMGTQILLAIKAFQMDNGKLPVSLEELVPEYLSQMPKDPFDGEPIRYSPEEKVVYSPQGENLFPHKDLIFKIEF